MVDELRLTTQERAFFRRFGGASLGLRLLSEAADQVDGLTAPKWVALSLESIQKGHLPPSTVEGQRLTALEGRHVALKFSGSREAFSPHACRGVNSSTKGPGSFVSARESTIRLAGEAADTAPEGTCAIILQEMVSSTPPFDYLTVHATDDKVVVEARDEQGVAIFESTRNGSWCESRDGSAVPTELRAEFEAVAALHRRLVALLGFELNTEGFRKDGEFVAIQLRPTPPDLPTDPGLTAQVWKIAAQPDAFMSHFVHGVYNLRGVVAREPATAGASIGVFTKPVELATLPDLAARIRPADLRVLEAKWPLRTSVWLSAANVAAELTGDQFLALDALDAFHLSHDVIHLPPVGDLRRRLKYAACGPIADSLVNGAEITAVSDGNYVAIRRLG